MHPTTFQYLKHHACSLYPPPSNSEWPTVNQRWSWYHAPQWRSSSIVCSLPSFNISCDQSQPSRWCFSILPPWLGINVAGQCPLKNSHLRAIERIAMVYFRSHILVSLLSVSLPRLSLLNSHPSLINALPMTKTQWASIHHQCVLLQVPD